MKKFFALMKKFYNFLKLVEELRMKSMEKSGRGY